MKVKELINILEKVEDKDRDVTILFGDEDNDYLEVDISEVHHTDDCEQCVELFVFWEDEIMNEDIR